MKLVGSDTICTIVENDEARKLLFMMCARNSDLTQRIECMKKLEIVVTQNPGYSIIRDNEDTTLVGLTYEDTTSEEKLAGIRFILEELEKAKVIEDQQLAIQEEEVIVDDDAEVIAENTPVVDTTVSP